MSRLNDAMGSLAPKIVFVFVCYMAAAISFAGFFEKWAFRDGMAYSAIEMLDGVAKRPWVYRQLLPATANLVHRVVPERLHAEFSAWLAADPRKRNFIHRYFSNAKDSTNPAYAVRYYTLFMLCFATFFVGILALRQACLEFLPDKMSATLSAIAIALAFPLITTEGGYMYDMAELMFMALAVLLAARGMVWPLAAVVLAATFNKESFLFFVITLYPLLRLAYPVRKTLLLQGMLLGIALVVNLGVKHYYAGNPGSFVVTQLQSHLLWLLDPRSYFQFEVNYAAITPKGFNLIHLVVVGYIVKQAWSRLPAAMKRHTQLALVINVPLFLAFCARGELRNLSMLIVPLAVMLSFHISQHLRTLYQPAAVAAEPAAMRDTSAAKAA